MKRYKVGFWLSCILALFPAGVLFIHYVLAGGGSDTVTAHDLSESLSEASVPEKLAMYSLFYSIYYIWAEFFLAVTAAYHFFRKVTGNRARVSGTVYVAGRGFATLWAGVFFLAVAILRYTDVNADMNPNLVPMGFLAAAHASMCLPLMWMIVCWLWTPPESQRERSDDAEELPVCSP